MPTLDQFIDWVNHFTYRLDLSGVLGLLGGGDAVEALETIHLYEGRRWTGWYNYPGTVFVARRFGQMVESRLWDLLFPGPDKSPTIVFNLAGESGPGYRGVFSGTELYQTKYLGYLLAQECAEYNGQELRLARKSGRERRKPRSRAAVTVVSIPPNQRKVLQNEQGRLSAFIKKTHEYLPVDPKADRRIALWAIFPSLISLLACVFCILGRDFYCASLLLLGIICSGVSTIILGAATLNIHVPVPPSGSPPGDGLLFPEDGSVIVLKGQEADVSIVTKGEFALNYFHGIPIGLCSLLLMAQFLAQLFLVPLCTLFGQILFLVSFVTSAAYHLYVVSHGREKTHRELLLRELSPRIDQRILETRTQMAVFVCLVLGDNGQHPRIKPDEILKCIIPNDTPVWRYWRVKVLKELAPFWKWESSFSYEPSIQAEPDDQIESEEYASFTDQEKELLNVLVDDTWCVFSEYPEGRDTEYQIGRECV